MRLPHVLARPSLRKAKIALPKRPQDFVLTTIAVDAFRTLPEAEPIPGPRSIDKQTINNLPLFGFEGTIVVVNTSTALAEAVAALAKESILGFDTETKPSFRSGESHPAALLQLAGEHTVWLFQLLQLEDLTSLFHLLENPAILKVGVAIRDDIRKLQERQPFTPGGFVEISEITQKAGIVNTGLRSLAALYLGIRISKGAQVTNWSRKSLTEVQVKYAATDSWVSRLLFLKLLSLGQASSYLPKIEPASSLHG